MKNRFISQLILISLIFFTVKCFLLPSQCNVEQYYDPGSMSCRYCPVNVSMVKSQDGFGCRCEEHSIPSGIEHCKPCNATEVVSADGTMCIPRRCQSSSGKVVCRRCPNDYISVTQNLDGSPLKEVQCVKCARGYKVQGNICVKCDSCACNKSQIIVRGICIPKAYINSRPKYIEKDLQPAVLLDILKHEYLCTQNSSRACRTLASECVKNFYMADLAGPCRLWIEPKLDMRTVLPQLIVDDKEAGSPVDMKSQAKNVFMLAAASYTVGGGLHFLQDLAKKDNECQLPVKFKIGEDMTYNCVLNLKEKNEININETLAPYLNLNGNYKPIAVILRTPNGNGIQKEKWPSDKFKRYFLVHNVLSMISNVTQIVYLRTLLLRLRLERNNIGNGSLKLHIYIEAQYSKTTTSSDTVTTSLKIENEMPNANIIKGLEILNGIFGALALLYSMVQWRGVIRRGDLYISLIPLLCGTIADTFYFATWLTTLHALSAEAGTLGMTLPLSKKQDYLLKALIISAFSLKIVKIIWMNWKQCQIDISILDWEEYNCSWREESRKNWNDSWKARVLLKEWSSMQTKRRVSPGFTVTIVLLISYFMSPWYSTIPSSQAYKWAITTIAWWSAYTTLLLSRWILNRVFGSPSAELLRTCRGVGKSLLVFQEGYYAHYVHGRNDDLEDMKSIVRKLSTCRVVCAPQFRAVYKQLSVQSSLSNNDTADTLLNKFLAAFFERALEGMNWVASERTLVERILDIELTSRESGYTSALLYDNDDTPSCFAVTWWGQEWTLSTFDAMLFSFVLFTTDDVLTAALVTLIVWQAMKLVRNLFGDRNLERKTNIKI